MWDEYYQKLPIYSIIVAGFAARNEPIIDQYKDQCKAIGICK